MTDRALSLDKFYLIVGTLAGLAIAIGEAA
jgi:hypothetical protein